MAEAARKPEAMARGARMLRTALGPAIAGFLEDPMIVEVMLNPDGRLWIDRLSEGLSDTGATLSPADGERIVRLVAHHVGAEVHAARPRVSAELPETGERFEGLLPPVVTAPCFAIRKPAVAVFTLADYVASGIMTESQAALLREGVAARANILVAGGTSTGKTTLTNALLAEVAGTADRVVIIEDTRELQCAAPNLVALRTKDGVASLSDLVRSSLRLRPDRVLALFDGIMPECRWMGDSETLTYLHSTISTQAHRIRVPETPAYLDALLADQPLTGGLEPRLGNAHLRVLTLSGFPTATTPGILDELNRLAFPYRWATRAILMDKTEAARMVARIRRQWFAKRKSIAAILKEVMTNEQSALVDTDAANKAADADMALQELGADIAGEAYVTATLIVWDEDPRRADEKLRLVEKVVQGRDFTAMVETVNAVDAWLGSLPGQAYANVRQPPISTLNLAHMIPLSAVWAGDERDTHFDGPPLLYGKTEGATPFRLSLHVGDVGHTLVVGPTGVGKSVLLALMALQFRRYPGAQIFAFDFGGSIRAATLAMGGDWHDLGGELTEGVEATVFLQPLARIDDPAERSWAAGWIGAMLAREGIVITPEVKEHLWSALTSLASAPIGERTITGLAVLLQSTDLKQALRPYCLGGSHGRLLDAEMEELGVASVQAFEIEGLVGTAAAPAVLSYLFHRIGDRLDGRPTLLIIDEGWLALDDEGFAGQLREWLKTLRKKNASVIFATQSLSDIDASAIAPAIIESCPTRLLLPNERAIEPQITAIYRRFGLNDRQIEILARATPKRDYYCQSRRGNRLFELGLSEVGLALCAASSKSDQTLISDILAEHGRDGFLAAWLDVRGVGWAAELIPDLINLAPEPEASGAPIPQAPEPAEETTP